MLAQAKPKPKLPRDLLKLLWHASAILEETVDMLTEVERGDMPNRFDLAGLIDSARDAVDDLDAWLPDDPAQAGLFD